MFINLFYKLKNKGVPVSTREFIHLLEAVEAGLADHNITTFYNLCKITLIKHEQHYDAFDAVFSEFIHDVQDPSPKEQAAAKHIPRNNITDLINNISLPDNVSAQEKNAFYEQLIELLDLEKAKGISTKIIPAKGNENSEQNMGGEGSSGGKTSVNAWDKREYKNLDNDAELSSRNVKLALKHLRLWTREGAPEELDLNTTIKKTAAQGGFLDLEIIPSEKNHVKVLMFFDVGGSMAPHVELCTQLFSAAHAEFKHLEYFYFHNCIYHQVWKDNRRRFGNETMTMEVLNKYNSSYKVIIVGDANMSPSEFLDPIGTYDSKYKESGQIWMKRMTEHFKYCVWINPLDVAYWQHSQSVLLFKRALNNRMFPLTLNGIKDAMKKLMSH